MLDHLDQGIDRFIFHCYRFANLPNHMYYGLFSILFGIYVGIVDPFSTSTNVVFQTYAHIADAWLWMLCLVSFGAVHIAGYYFKQTRLRYGAMLCQAWFWVTLFVMLLFDGAQATSIPLYGFMACMYSLELILFNKVR
jgi:hypothetical protein